MHFPSFKKHVDVALRDIVYWWNWHWLDLKSIFQPKLFYLVNNKEHWEGRSIFLAFPGRNTCCSIEVRQQLTPCPGVHAGSQAPLGDRFGARLNYPARRWRSTLLACNRMVCLPAGLEKCKAAPQMWIISAMEVPCLTPNNKDISGLVWLWVLVNWRLNLALR